MDAIKVGIRVRPLLKREVERGSQWIAKSNSIVQKCYTSSPYYFDHVFNMESSTIDIFNALAEPIVLSVMEGFNGTIFAYGQTSSGKTHTMMGGKDDSGIIPLTISRIYEYMAEHPKREFLISASFLEIHNEKLTDLLNPENKRLKIRENCERNVKLVGITEKSCLTFDEIADLLRFGQSYRSMGETLLNDESSRSHTIFTLTIESKLREGIENEADGVVKVAALNLVDLAGSERTSAAGTEGVRFKEGTYINLSLLVLGKVISKLSSGSSHVPFRDSKLTRILQSSLGGNAKTCIICTMTPAEVTESHSTLKFANRAMTVKNRPKVNEVLVSEESLIKRVKLMEAENMRLREQLEEGLSADERHQLVQLATSETEKNCLDKHLKALLETLVKNSELKTNDRRKTFYCNSRLSTASVNDPPFLSKFNQKTFGTHLEEVENEYCDTPCMKSITKRRKRVSFIPELIRTPLNFYAEDSLDSQDTRHMVDVEVQTDSTSFSWLNDCDFTHLEPTSNPAFAPIPSEVQSSLNSTAPLRAVSVHMQTEDVLTMPTATQTSPTSRPCLADPEVTLTSPFASAALATSGEWSSDVSTPPNFSTNNAIIAESLGRKLAAEKFSIIQFENEELKVMVNDMQKHLEMSETPILDVNAELKCSEAKVAAFQMKIDDLELSSCAQEELLLQLQYKLKAANFRLNETLELNHTLQQAKFSRINQENQDLLQEVSQDNKALKVIAPRTDSSTESYEVNKDATSAAAELQQAHRVIEELMLERDKLTRAIECSSLDLKDYNSLLKELDETKSLLKKASLFEDKVNHAMGIIDEQAAELVVLKLKLADCTDACLTSAEGADSLAAELLGVTNVQGQSCLSLDEELAQAMGGGSCQSLLAESAKVEDETVVRELREKLQNVASELVDTKSENDRVYDKWKNSQEKCEMAYVEVAGLREELMVLHNKLQLSTPAKLNHPLITLHSVKATPFKLCEVEEVEYAKADNGDTQRLEVLHDDYVARLQSAEQDQEELRHENSCLDEVVLQLREQTVGMEKEIDSLKEENRMSALQLQKVQDSFDTVKSSEESMKARAVEAEQQSMSLKETLEEATTQHEQLSACREKAMCSLREQLAKMEQEVRLLKCEKQDTVETNANLLRLEVLHDDYVARLKSAEQDQEELRREVENKTMELKRLHQTIKDQRGQNSCLDEVVLQLREQTVGMVKEIDSLKEENRMSELQLQKVQDSFDTVKSSEESIKARAVEAEQESKFLKETLDEAASRHERLSACREKTMCSLREQLAELEQEVELLRSEKQDMLETNANLLRLEVLHDDYVARLKSAEQDQEELRREVENKMVELKRLHQTINDQRRQNSCLDEVVLQLREQTVGMEKEIDSLKVENRMSELQLQKVQDKFDTVKSTEESMKARAVEAEQQSMSLKETLEEAATQHEQLSACREKAMCSLREQLAKMEQEVRLLKCEKQDTVETNANLLRLEVLHDDYVARLKSAEQDQEELRREVENKTMELKRLHQTIKDQRRQNSCLDEVVLQLREQTVGMEKEIDSLKVENRMSELQLQKVQDCFDTVKSSEESIKARAVEAEQQSKFLKETLDEAASRHERLSACREKAMCSLKKQLAELEQEVGLLRSEKQDTVATNANLLNSFSDGEDLIQLLGANEVKNVIQKENTDLHSSEIRLLEKRVHELQEMHKGTFCRLSEENTRGAAQAYQLKEEIEAVRRENTLLKQKIQGMATVPKMSGSTVVDGSGAVTGVAFHQLQKELTVMAAEKEEQRYRAVTASKKLDIERQNFEKMKHERGLFRSKYTRMKETCTCDAAQRMKRVATQLQQQQKCPVFAASTTLLTKECKSTQPQQASYPIKPLWSNKATTDTAKSMPKNEGVPAEKLQKQPLLETASTQNIKSQVCKSSLPQLAPYPIKPFWFSNKATVTHAAKSVPENEVPVEKLQQQQQKHPLFAAATTQNIKSQVCKSNLSQQAPYSSKPFLLNNKATVTDAAKSVPENEMPAESHCGVDCDKSGSKSKLKWDQVFCTKQFVWDQTFRS